MRRSLRAQHLHLLQCPHTPSGASFCSPPLATASQDTCVIAESLLFTAPLSQWSGISVSLFNSALSLSFQDTSLATKALVQFSFFCPQTLDSASQCFSRIFCLYPVMSSYVQDYDHFFPQILHLLFSSHSLLWLIFHSPDDAKHLSILPPSRIEKKSIYLQPIVTKEGTDERYLLEKCRVNKEKVLIPHRNYSMIQENKFQRFKSSLHRNNSVNTVGSIFSWFSQ